MEVPITNIVSLRGTISGPVIKVSLSFVLADRKDFDELADFKNTDKPVSVSIKRAFE
jgi:hypothetical protein